MEKLPYLGVILAVAPDGAVIANDCLRCAVMNCTSSIAEFESGKGSEVQIEEFKLRLADHVLFAIGFPDQNWLSRSRKTKKKNHNRESGFVYLMLNNRNKLIKIGWSTKPEFREKTLQSEDPDISMIRMWPGSIADEKALHQSYNEFRIRGEWFALSDNHISSILEANHA